MAINDIQNDTDAAPAEYVPMAPKLIAHRQAIRGRYVGHDRLAEREVNLVRLLTEIETRMQSPALSDEHGEALKSHRLTYSGQLDTCRKHLQRLDAIRRELVHTGQEMYREQIQDLDERIAKAFKESLAQRTKSKFARAAQCVELQAERRELMMKLLYED